MPQCKACAASTGRERSNRAGLLRLLAAVLMLAGCQREQAQRGPVPLDLHIFPEPSGAFEKAAAACSQASQGRYQIRYHRLPHSADDQRQQMVRRLAAQDASLDILGLDVVWVSEFAEAGWIREWTGKHARAVREGTLKAPLETATWKGKLYAAPLNTNTQLLWYRADLVPNPPATWDEMIQMAEHLADAGKPHYIEVQGAPYEGLTVWFNTLVESAGGSILHEGGERVALGEPARKALALMARFARSRAADPSLSNQMENENRLRMEAGAAAFELNYPYVYPSMRANRPDLFPHFRWALYPRVEKEMPARVTIGGNNLAVSAYSPHPELAFEAASCLRSRAHQLENAILGGIPPTITSLYDEPALRSAFPFAEAVRASLETASVRPETPAYQSASVVISHTLSPPAEIEPKRTLETLEQLLRDALLSRGVIP